jgi:two-component system cell cycle sensor histidine kinase/response regulator CckA
VHTPAGPRRILLVEDEAPLARLAARTLRAAGYEVERAEDGEQALEHADALGADLDLVVSDVVMPRRSGPALVDLLRRKRPDLPVVLMSGYPDASAGSPIPENVVFLLKPFQPSELRDAVAQALAPCADEPGVDPAP